MSLKDNIFKENVPITILINLITDISGKIKEKNNTYFIDTASFKKGILNGKIEEFFSELKPFYHESKQTYLERRLTYNHFITVLRQVCKNTSIKYTKHMRYEKSTYEVVYHIESIPIPIPNPIPNPITDS